MMFYKILAAVILLTLSVSGQKLGSCKDPTVVHRLLADDVRYASPFYVIALPKTATTEQIDNVCYTYFETGKGSFFHIISVTYKNGSNAHYKFSKGDISDRIGLAQATAEKTSSCVYHDYTLTPICNVSVFILYRCFIEGNCNDIDIGITPGVDVRVVLAASTKISDSCLLETEANLKNTTSLEGGDYIILPQNRKPQCVTRYNSQSSINSQNALGSLTILEDDVADRLAENNEDLEFTGTTPSVPTQDNLMHSHQSEKEMPNPTEASIDLSVIEKDPIDPNQQQHIPLTSSQSTLPKKSYADVVKSPSPATKPTTGSNSNVIYHIHKWDSPPPGCCKCS